MEKFCLGIDIDKQTFKVCLMGMIEGKRILGSRTFSNTISGFSELATWACKKLNGKSASYLMEATGVYHEHLAYYLHDQGESVHVVLPLKSKRYMQSLGLRSKTDLIDAKGLAMMGLEQTLDEWKPGSKQLLELRSLTRQIEMLQEHRTSFKNQLEAANHSAVMHRSVIKSIQQLIGQVEKQLVKLEKQIKQLVESDAYLNEKYALFATLKGVGIMTFAVVASETNGFSLFNNQRQLVCYSGYDVLQNESGQRVGKTRISKKGNTHIRRILHLAAWSAVKHKSSPFCDLYQRVFQRTGIKMKGYVAVQRKLLVMVYTLWKKNEVFDPDFRASGNHEPKSLCSVGSQRTRNKTAPIQIGAALDGLPCNQSPEALCSVS